MDKSLYTRPDKPKAVTVTRRRGALRRALPELPQAMAVDKATECHVTPADVAARMVDALGHTGDYLTLEPCAGTGNLIAALFDAGHAPGKLVAVERYIPLCNALAKRFRDRQAIEPINACFLEYAARAAGGIEYPRIIMNPPFRTSRAHIAAALSLLGRGGHECATLVALVPITFTHDEAETLEELPNDTFANAKVWTKIIRVRR